MTLLGLWVLSDFVRLQSYDLVVGSLLRLFRRLLVFMRSFFSVIMAVIRPFIVWDRCTRVFYRSLTVIIIAQKPVQVRRGPAAEIPAIFPTGKVCRSSYRTLPPPSSSGT